MNFAYLTEETQTYTTPPASLTLGHLPLKGEAQAAPGCRGLCPGLQRKIIGGEEPITCRPADLIPPEWEKAKAEIGPLAANDEEVLMYALFPAVARPYPFSPFTF